MISWIVIIILVIVGIIGIRMNHLRHRVWILLLVFFALFLYITISVVNVNNKLDFSSTQGVINSGKIYLNWLANGFQNVKALAGNAIKMDWTKTGSSKNQTSVKKTVKKSQVK